MGLVYGRTAARETQPVKPILDLDVGIALSFVTPVIAAMVMVQRLTGMRAGEVIIMRPCDINTSDDVWIYKPSDHKTRWRGHEKEIPLGPDVQQALGPFMKRDPQKFLFSPQESVAWQVAHEPAYFARKRTTKAYPCEVKRLAKNKEARLQHTRKRPIGDRYDTNAYRRALVYGFDKARKMGFIISHWHPHQLRHTRATEIRRLFGLEAAQVALGHKSADITQVYAEKNMERATQIAKAMG